MNRNFERSLSLVLKHEGGWADHPSDPGGATMKGVTIATYRRFINPKGTRDDLRNITPAQVADVYRREYWAAVKADDLPDGLDYALFDFAVNSGPARAVQYLQAAVGVAQDGKIGPQTLNALSDQPAARLVNSLCDARLFFMRKLKTWETFGKGWSSRVAGVRKEALIMCAVAHAVPVQPVPVAPAPETAPKVETPPVAPRIEPGAVVHVEPDGTIKPGGSGPYVERNWFWAALLWLLDLITKRK